MIENMWFGELFEWNYRKRINGWLAKMHIYNQEQSCQKWHKSKINSFKNSHFAYWIFKLKISEIHLRVTVVQGVPENQTFSSEKAIFWRRSSTLTVQSLTVHFDPWPSVDDVKSLYDMVHICWSKNKCDAEKRESRKSILIF